MSRITDFCICVYVFGCKLSLFRLCGSDCGITAVDDITIGIPCAAFCFHIAHISFASSWYLLCFLVIVLARLCVYYYYYHNYHHHHHHRHCGWQPVKITVTRLYIRNSDSTVQRVIAAPVLRRYEYRALGTKFRCYIT